MYSYPKVEDGDRYWSVIPRMVDVAFYKTEAEKLKEKNVPVHTFWMD